MSALGKRKRSLPLQHCQDARLRQTVTEQIDLEIALKKRLLAAARARLEWALILRKYLLEPVSSITTPSYPPTAFRDAALAAYEAIEAPCRFIASTSELIQPPLNNAKPPALQDVRASEAPRTRKRATLALGQGSSNVGPLLFEDRSTSTPVTLKLVCSDCARSDFPTMQGFLNHCRLGHSRNYGTHDECIQVCGVVVGDSEREALLAAGVEIKTIDLPSLKRIFERAVGLGQNMALTSENTERIETVEEPSMASTHLSQTLGLHVDTPTLAPFLGKKVRKKCIHVHEGMGSIDVISTDVEASRRRSLPWLAKRKAENSDGDMSVNMAALALEKTGNIQGPHHVLNGTIGDQGSRFHITRRIIVADKSLYLPEDKRPSNTNHTHRWQVFVSSPSYGQHITTFLSRLIVTCVTQPPAFRTPIIISRPPFVACSTTDRPFLACLTLEWVGQQNKPYVLEHWVELDQLKTGRPILGAEQMLDIELDRNTVFSLASATAGGVPWNGEGDYGRTDMPGNAMMDSRSAGVVDEFNASEPKHIKLLRGVIQRFPITLQDVGPRQSPKVPYVVYPSPAKLLSLIPGRRKAIEWARAVAIRSEYDTLVASSSSSEDNDHMTTADIYRWLDAEGLFPRHRPKVQIPAPQPEATESPASMKLDVIQSFCAVCGVDVRFHAPGILNLRHGGEDEAAGFHCPAELERRRAPLVHVYALVAPLRIPYWALRYNQVYDSVRTGVPRDFVALAHPILTRFVRQQVASLHLPCFDLIDENKDRDTVIGHELTLGSNRSEVETVFAPCAFLAIVLEKAVRDLVGSALQVARESQSRTKTASGMTRGITPMSLLTPTHVLQGLVKGAESGGPKEALFKSFSRVGTLLEVPQPREGTGQSSGMHL